MTDNTREVIVNIGSYFVSTNPTRLICLGLGSCVAVAIHDPMKRVGGLAHVMLPRFEEGRDKRNPAKYADTATYLMVDELLELGASKKRLQAKLVGGAQMFSHLSSDVMDVGVRNISAAREALGREEVPILAEEVGGRAGRTVTFDIASGDIEVRMVGRDFVTL